MIRLVLVSRNDPFLRNPLCGGNYFYKFFFYQGYFFACRKLFNFNSLSNLISLEQNLIMILLSLFLPPSLPANTYFFMVQAQGIMIRDNVRTIGQIIRSYTNKNSTLNGTGERKCTHPDSYMNHAGVLNSVLALKAFSFTRCVKVISSCMTVLSDYPDGNNSSEYFAQPTTYLPENFTYAQNLPCPERLPSMSEFLKSQRLMCVSDFVCKGSKAFHF